MSNNSNKPIPADKAEKITNNNNLQSSASSSGGISTKFVSFTTNSQVPTAPANKTNTTSTKNGNSNNIYHSTPAISNYNMQHYATSSRPATAFNNCNDSNIANANLQEAPTKTTSGGIEATKSTASCWMEDLFQNSTAIIENNSLNFTGSKRNFHKKIKLVGKLISSQQLSSYINLGKIIADDYELPPQATDD